MKIILHDDVRNAIMEGMEVAAMKWGKHNIELLEKYHVSVVDKQGNTVIRYGKNEVTTCSGKRKRYRSLNQSPSQKRKHIK